MLVKMAEKQPKQTPSPHVAGHKLKAPHFLPTLEILFSLLVMAVAVASFFNWYNLPEMANDIIMFVAGIWLLLMGLEYGVSQRRRDILKRYI